MPWETPSYLEINMNAEIGGYQDDFDEHTPRPEDTRIQHSPDQNDC